MPDSTKFDKFFETLVFKGLESFRRYYSVYRAFVTSNSDPQKRGRIQVKVPEAGQTKPVDQWVDPIFLYAGSQHGMFFPPEVEDKVWVAFAYGDASNAPGVYFGGWFTESAVPSVFAYGDDGTPVRRGIVTKSGHALVFDDTSEKESVRLIWKQGDSSSFISFESNGDIQIRNKSGSVVHLDSENKNFKAIDENGNSVTLDSDGIKIIDKSGNLVTIANGDITLMAKGDVVINGSSANLKTGGVFLADGASDYAVLGQKLIQYLNTHQHGTGTGPSSPPLVPATPTILSQKVKLA